MMYDELFFEDLEDSPDEEEQFPSVDDIISHGMGLVLPGATPPAPEVAQVAEHQHDNREAR